MTDQFDKHATGLQSPAISLLAIAPSDTVDLPQASRALNVAQGGLVRVTTVDGSVGTLFVGAGIPFPIRVTRVWATGTSATGIVALS